MLDLVAWVSITARFGGSRLFVSCLWVEDFVIAVIDPWSEIN